MTTRRFVLLLVLGALALFLPTWSPVVTWTHFGEDGPELEAAGRTLGVAHPTGYPLFLLATRLVSLVAPPPVSAVNVITLLAGVAAVVCTGILGRVLAGRIFPGAPEMTGILGGLAAAGFLATSLTVWRQASIGEVYTLHLALTAAVLCLIIDRRPRNGLLAAYLLGLGMAHHLQTLPLLLVVLAYWALGRSRPRWITVPVFLFPLTLYGVLLIRSQGDPAFDWGNPETLRGLWWTVTGTPYRGNLLGGGLEPALARAVSALGHGPVAQVGWAGALLGVLGGLTTLIRARREGFALFLLWGGTTVVAATYAIPDPGAYYLPAVLAVSAAAGVGAGGLWGWVTTRPRSSLVRLAGGVAVWAMLAGGLAAQIHRVRPLADATRDVGAYAYARQGIDVLESDALVVSHGDGRTFSLWYGTTVLASRPDVAVLYDTLLDWPWYRKVVGTHHPSVSLPPPGIALEARRLDLVQRNIRRRPVYVTALDPAFLDRFEVTAAGFLYRLAPRRPEATGATSNERTDTDGSHRLE